MIKIETNYEDETDSFTWNYECEHSHTMEHLAVVQNLCETIMKNDTAFDSYKKILKFVEKMAKAIEKKEEISNE
jgi:hypothetical protein